MPAQSTTLPYRAPRLTTAAPPRPADTTTTVHRQPVSRMAVQSRTAGGVGAGVGAGVAPARAPQALRPTQALRSVPPIRPVPQLPAPPRQGVWTDRGAWLATVDGRVLSLTYLEFEVLDFFLRHPGTAHSRQALLASVWGHRPDDQSAPDARTVDVLVTRLRRKLGPEHRYRIETVRRVGYRYRPIDLAIG
ncbi:winged helix-turn-helix domain-containing protein [Frankia sp. AgPm24]|uniref:winged helix-turn-helix domain-containing protein n=1 Tax=Frankia sp. AgPm24 TaxID=631128 RepID=UPI00200C7407|nr:winged helix-turn-helix domain-containing protein [Frankia sp. AgPm24]MCK9921662.1 winged helix-turn-helix domain-containing protein [Frankia sp. AgPm24]